MLESCQCALASSISQNLLICRNFLIIQLATQVFIYFFRRWHRQLDILLQFRCLSNPLTNSVVETLMVQVFLHSYSRVLVINLSLKTWTGLRFYHIRLIHWLMSSLVDICFACEDWLIMASNPRFRALASKRGKLCFSHPRVCITSLWCFATVSTEGLLAWGFVVSIFYFILFVLVAAENCSRLNLVAVEMPDYFVSVILNISSKIRSWLGTRATGYVLLYVLIVESFDQDISDDWDCVSTSSLHLVHSRWNSQAEAWFLILVPTDLKFLWTFPSNFGAGFLRVGCSGRVRKISQWQFVRVQTAAPWGFLPLNELLLFSIVRLSIPAAGRLVLTLW